MKKLCALFLSLLMVVLVAAGCDAAPAASGGSSTPGSTEGSGAPPTGEEAEDVTIKFMSWSAGADQESALSAIDTFKKQNPHITIETEFVDNSNYHAKLNTLMAAETPPDLAQLNGNLVPEYGAKDQLVDVTPYLDGVDMDDIMEEAIFEYDGKIYGLCYGVQCLMAIYNKELFRQAGIPEPSTDASDPWTWEEYVDAAVKLTTDVNGKHPNEEGFDYENVAVWGTFANTAMWQNFVLLNSNGGAYIAPEGDKLLVDTPESMEVLQALQDLIYKHQVAPKPSFVSAMPWSLQMLVDGQAGICLDGQWCLTSLDSFEFRDYGIAPLPMFNKPTNMIWGEPMCVFNTGDESRQSAAAELSIALGDPAVVPDLFSSGSQMPIYKSYYTDPEKMSIWLDNTAHSEDIIEMYPTLFDISTTREAYFVKNYDPIAAIVNPRLDKIWNGEDVEASLEGIQEEVASEMQGAYKVVDYFSDAKE